MSKQKTIGSNPLDAYLTYPKQKKNPKKEEAEPPQQYSQEQQHVKKQRITIHLSVDLIDRVKNAVYWEPGLTVTSFAEQALEAALKKLEKARGEVYPTRRALNLKGGRPLS